VDWCHFKFFEINVLRWTKKWTTHPPSLVWFWKIFDFMMFEVLLLVDFDAFFVPKVFSVWQVA
jgi:hypothetical protein